MEGENKDMVDFYEAVQSARAGGAKYGISVDFVTNRVRVIKINESSDVYKVCELDSMRVKLCK